MDIGVIGTGYVGLVTGACFADRGHSVICADIDAGKIAALNRGAVPYYEPGLEDLVAKATESGRLQFTSSVEQAVRQSNVVFIAVGTPSRDDGSPDTRAVYGVARTIARSLDGHTTIVVKSTVPAGTSQAVRSIIAQNTNVPFALVNNPEFLREGHSIEDFMWPSRVVIGTDSSGDEAALEDLYKDFVAADRILIMDTRSSEMCKYASNAFLATKISFVNEMANLCEAVNADIELVRQAVGLDPRIGPGHLYPGIGYGGSCLPKDVEAVLYMGSMNATPLDILSAVQKVNTNQPQRLFDKVRDYFDGQVAGKRIAMWGLAFKPESDDMRGAPSLTLIDIFVKAGAQVTAYDPQASARAKSLLNGTIQYADDQYRCLSGADALAVVTEWDQFRSPDWNLVREYMRTPVVFDGRNIYDPDLMESLGIPWFGVGRSKAPSTISTNGHHEAILADYDDTPLPRVISYGD